MPKSQVHTNFVNVSHPRELNDAANITTIRRTAMLAIHRDKRCIRAKKALAVPQMEVAIALDNDMGGNSGQLLQNTIVIPELVEVQSVSLNWQDEDANQEILANGVGDSSSSFYSMLDMPTSVDDGICYTAHMCYPSQSYLLNHCMSKVRILALPNRDFVCQVLHSSFAHDTSNSMLMNLRDHCFGAPFTSRRDAS